MSMLSALQSEQQLITTWFETVVSFFLLWHPASNWQLPICLVWECLCLVAAGYLNLESCHSFQVEICSVRSLVGHHVRGLLGYRLTIHNFQITLSKRDVCDFQTSLCLSRSIEINCSPSQAPYLQMSVTMSSYSSPTSSLNIYCLFPPIIPCFPSILVPFQLFASSVPLYHPSLQTPLSLVLVEFLMPLVLPSVWKA